MWQLSVALFATPGLVSERVQELPPVPVPVFAPESLKLYGAAVIDARSA
jgi:hypothetical protein